jgi:phosphatidylglycerol:prolipoprotein diacylglycerol transferase
MFPVLQVGSLSIQMPGLLLLVGFWLGLSQIERRAEYYGSSSKQLDDLVFWGAICGVAAARLSYVVRFPTVFGNHWLDLISLDTSLFDVPAGLVTAVLAGLIIGQRKKLRLLDTLDAFVPGLAVMLIAVGLAHAASGEAYGMPTQLPWGIWLWGEIRHPTQVYEVLAAIGILAILTPKYSKGAGAVPKALIPGQIFFRFLAMFAGAAIFLESFRGDSAVIFGQLRIAQLEGLALLGFSLWQLYRLEKNREESSDELKEASA